MRWLVCSLLLATACGDDDPTLEASTHGDGGVSHDTSPDAGGTIAADGARVFTIECGSTTDVTFEESEVVRFELRCAQPLEVVRMPEGATFDGAWLRWQPDLAAAGPFTIELQHGDSRTLVRGFVLDRFDAPGNQLVENHAEYTYEHGLPVVHLRWHSTDPGYCRDAVARDSVPADIMVLGHAYEGAELRCRGKTSIAFPKKNFSLRFSKRDPFHAPPGLERFEGARRLSLTQTFDDNSQIRTRMSLELHRRLDAENVYLDHASVVVFVDGAYHGLYQLTDNVGLHFLARRGLDDDEDTAQIFKSVDHRGNYRTTWNGQLKSDLSLGFEKDEGEPEDDFSGLFELLRYVSDTTDADFVAGFDTMLRGDDFLDWYLFTTALIAEDNYAKNSYVYRDTDGPDTRFRYIPWDLNESWGQNWYTGRVLALSDTAFPALLANRNGIFARIVAIPALRARLRQRMQSALKGPMAKAEVLALFDRLRAEVALSARRDDRRWDAERRAYPLFASREDFTTFDEEMVYMRTWIELRWSWLEALYFP